MDLDDIIALIQAISLAAQLGHDDALNDATRAKSGHEVVQALPVLAWRHRHERLLKIVYMAGWDTGKLNKPTRTP